MRELLQESNSSGVDKSVGIALGVAGGVIVITGIIWFLYRRYAGLGGNLAGIAPERKMLVFTDLGRLADSTQQHSQRPSTTRPPLSSCTAQRLSPAGLTSPRPTSSRPVSASRTPSPPAPALSASLDPLDPFPSTPGSISSPRGQGRTLFTSAWERTSTQTQPQSLQQPHQLHRSRPGNLQSAGTGPSGSAPSAAMAVGDPSDSRRASATGGGCSVGPPFSYATAVMAPDLEAVAAAGRSRLSSAGRSALHPSASGAGPHPTHGATSTSRPSSGAPGTRPGSAASAAAAAAGGTLGPPAAVGGGSGDSRSGPLAPGATATVLPPALVPSGSLSIAWQQGPMGSDPSAGAGDAGVGFHRPVVSHSPLEPFLTAIPRPPSLPATGPLMGSAAAAAAGRTSYGGGPSGTSPVFGLPVSGRPPLPGRSPGPGQPSLTPGVGVGGVAAPSAASCGSVHPVAPPGLGAAGAWGLTREHSPPQEQTRAGRSWPGSGGVSVSAGSGSGGGSGAQSRGRPGGLRTPRSSQPNASRPSSTGVPDEGTSGTSTQFHSFTAPGEDTVAATAASGASASGANAVNASAANASGRGASAVPVSNTPTSAGGQVPQPHQLSHAHALISFRQYSEGEGDGGGTDGSLQGATEIAAAAGTEETVSVRHTDERFTFHSDARDEGWGKEWGKEAHGRSPAMVAVVAAAVTAAENPGHGGDRRSGAGVAAAIKLEKQSEAGAGGGVGAGGVGGGVGPSTAGSSPATSPTQLAWAAAMTLSSKLLGRSSRSNNRHRNHS